MKNTKRSIPTNLKPQNNVARVVLSIFLASAVIMAFSACRAGIPSVSPTVDLPSKLEKKEEMVIPMTSEPSSMNPLETKSKEMVFLFSLIFESPLRCGENGQPEPDLVENWTCDDAGKVWTFNLRKDIHFQTGEELTAADIVYTLDQLKNYSTDQSSYADSVKDMTSYESKDDYTLTVEASQPGSAILYDMMFPVLSKKYYGSDSAGTKKTPKGTGPYSLTSYQIGQGMVLTANENWWKKQPAIKKITAKSIPDNQAALTAYENGELDMVYTPEFTAGKYKEAGKTQVTEVPTMNYECLIPNTASAGLSDNRMRQALLCALDRQELIRRAYLGHAVITDVPIPPQSYLYDGRYKVYEYEPVKAKSLLEDLGWTDKDGDGLLEDSEGKKLVLRLLYNDDIDNPARKEAARTIAEQLGKLGVTIQLDGQVWSKYVTKLNSRQYDLALGGYNVRVDMDLNSMLESSGERNLSKYKNTDMDNALKKFASAFKTEDEKAAASELQRLFVEGLPNIPLCFRSNLLVHAEKLDMEGSTDTDIFKRIERWVLYQ